MPLLKETEFKKHISAGDFSNLYLIYGEEKMYVKVYTEKLVEKIMGKNPPEFNYHTFNNESDIKDISSSIQIMPFLSKYNCVKISDYDVNALKKDSLKDFTEILKNIPETTVVIITMPTLEQDLKKLGNFKSITDLAEKKGISVMFPKCGAVKLERILVNWAEKSNAVLSPVNAGKIISFCSNDLNLLKNEINKMASYVNGGEITPEIIDKMATKNLEAKVFDLVDSIVAGNGDKAYKQLDILFYNNEKPTLILSVIASNYIDMYRVRICDESGEGVAVIADEFNYKNRKWVLDKARKKSAKLSTKALRQSIDAITELDAKFKSVSIDYRTALEKLISRLSLIAKGEINDKN